MDQLFSQLLRKAKQQLLRLKDLILAVHVNAIAPIGALVTNLSKPQVCHLPIAVTSQTSYSELVTGVGPRYSNNLPVEAIREEIGTTCSVLPSQPVVPITTPSWILPFPHYNEIDHLYHPSPSFIESPENVNAVLPTNVGVTVSPIQESTPVNNVNMLVGSVVRDSHSTDGGAYKVKNNGF